MARDSESAAGSRYGSVTARGTDIMYIARHCKAGDAGGGALSGGDTSMYAEWAAWREVRQCDCSEGQTACTLHDNAGLVALSVWGGRGGGLSLSGEDTSRYAQRTGTTGCPLARWGKGGGGGGGDDGWRPAASRAGDGAVYRGRGTIPGRGGWGIVSRGPEHGRCMLGREV